MRSKIIKYGADARTEMLKGIDELEKAVTTTLGPKGRNVLIDKGKQYPTVTKDGVSVARQVFVKDRTQQAGIQMIKEAAERTNITAGDGTTTTILLASELAKAGVKLITSDYDPVEVQRGYDYACDRMIEALGKYKKIVESPDDIEHVAFVSANNDPEVSKVVRDAFEGLGENGIVDITDSHNKSGKTTIRFSNGLQFPKGIQAGSFVTNIKTDSFEADNARVIILDFCPEKEWFIKEMESAYKVKTPLVFISNGMEDEVFTLISSFNAKKLIPMAIITPPGFSEYDIMENQKDLAVLLNCEVTTEENYKNKEVNLYGKCGHIVSDAHKTSISGLESDDARIEERISQIKDQMEVERNSETGLGSASELDYKKRIANMSGGIATIEVGGHSETRIKELTDRYEDAVKACQAAIKDGIVPGGGTTLLKASNDVRENLKEIENRTKDFQAGVNAFLNVMEIPMTRIISSVTRDYAFIISNVKHSENLYSGYNAKTQTYVDDMFVEGIIDPYNVEKYALTYATAVAGVFITTECAIVPDAPNVENVSTDPIMDRIPGGMR